VNRAILPIVAGLLYVSPAFTAPEPPNCEAALCQLVTAGSHPDLRWPDFSAYTERIRKFYEPTSYAPAWTHTGAPTEQAKVVIAVLKNAAAKGLNAEDYDGSRWDRRLAQLSDATVAAFDLDLTVSAMRYICDLHFGRANPDSFHSGSDPKEELSDLSLFLRQRVVDATDLKSTLDKLEPPYPGYRRTQQALQSYLAMANAGALPMLAATTKTVEPGAPYPAVAQLAVILRRFGDLPADATVAADSAAYDGPLVDAVKHFQMRHGLEPDGRLGKTTFAQLNTPLSQRILQLQLSMERWRWVPHNFSRPPIVVNIPEFRLRALNAAYQTDLEMKVVVGSAYGGHQTPVFSAEMKYVVFRPYWDVPYSIAHVELAPKIAKDHGYLAKNGYEVVDAKEKAVGDGNVDDAMLAQIRTGKLRIRQIPGPKNALGLVKFLFPNEYNVYLHSTPAPELFSKSRRDFSHGCIRVENPEDMAAWVLHDKPEWTPERIHDAMNGDDTVQVTLDAPIPVLIVYATAVVLGSGDVRFFDDIYKQDAQLELTLASGPVAHH
jgi:murein L,D-transpeptidase YcbB/YkuD